jgi:NADH-quinone oxidoreductase subunit N
MTNSLVYFNFLATLSVLLFPALVSLMYFASAEKTFPYYSQERGSYVFVLICLASAFFLNAKGYVFTTLPLSLDATDQALLPMTNYLVPMLVLDPLSSVTRSIILLAALVGTIFSFTYHKLVRYNAFEFSFYILLSTAAMLVFVSSSNAVLTYVSIELQSLSFYLMAASARKSVHSVEAGLKYLFIGSLASGLLLLSFIYLYLATGSLNFYEMGLDSFFSWQNADRLEYFFDRELAAEHMRAATYLFILAMLIKMAAGPFHLWSVDVYDGSPTAATGFFLLVPKISALVMLFRFTHDAFLWEGEHGLSLIYVFSFVVAATFIFGYNGMMSKHISLKRFFTFSAIGNLGFLLLPNTNIIERGFSSDISGDSGVYSLFMYLLPYMMLTIPSLAFILSFTTRNTFSNRKEHYVLANLPQQYHLQNPAHALLFFFLVIVLIGLPPTAGFFMKLFPLISYASGGYGWITLFIWASLLISAYVYADLIVRLFFISPNLWDIESWREASTEFKHYPILLISSVIIMYLSFYVGQGDLFEMVSVLAHPLSSNF